MIYSSKHLFFLNKILFSWINLFNSSSSFFLSIILSFVCLIINSFSFIILERISLFFIKSLFIIFWRIFSFKLFNCSISSFDFFKDSFKKIIVSFLNKFSFWSIFISLFFKDKFFKFFLFIFSIFFFYYFFFFFFI